MCNELSYICKPGSFLPVMGRWHSGTCDEDMQRSVNSRLETVSVQVILKWLDSRPKAPFFHLSSPVPAQQLEQKDGLFSVVLDGSFPFNYKSSSVYI